MCPGIENPLALQPPMVVELGGLVFQVPVDYLDDPVLRAHAVPGITPDALGHISLSPAFPADAARRQLLPTAFSVGLTRFCEIERVSRDAVPAMMADRRLPQPIPSPDGTHRQWSSSPSSRPAPRAFWSAMPSRSRRPRATVRPPTPRRSS
jgi:hypothetical protein